MRPCCKLAPALDPLYMARFQAFWLRTRFTPDALSIDRSGCGAARWLDRRQPRGPCYVTMGADHVFHRSTQTRPPLAVRGEGITLIDEQGRRYIDACGGAAVSCLGHGHPEIVAAMSKQAASLEYIHTGFS